MTHVFCETRDFQKDGERREDGGVGEELIPKLPARFRWMALALCEAKNGLQERVERDDQLLVGGARDPIAEHVQRARAGHGFPHVVPEVDDEGLVSVVLSHLVPHLNDLRVDMVLTT